MATNNAINANSTSPLPITDGGTGANNASSAQTNLGLGTMAVQNANSVAITGGSAELGTGTVATTPTNSTDIANKSYVDSVASGLTFISSCRVATTVDLNSTYNNGSSGVGATLTCNVNGAITVDGVALSLNDRVLVKNQTSNTTNGIYSVTQVGTVSTPFILTRTTDYDTPSQIKAGTIAFITAGTTYTNTSFIETNPVVTIGVSPIVFVQFSQTYPLTMGNGGTGANITPTNNNLVYSNSSTMALLATANNSVLVTSGAGAPSLSTTLPSGLTIPGFAKSGANADITSMTGLTGALQAPTAVLDSNGNEVVAFTGVASAVNEIALTNNVTGTNPELGCSGSDTNIGITYRTKATGAHQFISNNTTVPILWSTGTTAQHTTGWSVPNTSASRTITLQDASGTMAFLSNLSMVQIATGTASNSAAVDLTGMTGYTNYIVFFSNLTPVTSAASLLMQVSINNGSTFISSSNSYRYENMLANNTSVIGAQSLGDTKIQLATSINNTAGIAMGGWLQIMNPAGGFFTTILFNSLFIDSTGAMRLYQTGGQCIATTSAVNALGFFMSSGNISTGNFQLYGVT